jgi:hypothetical protein
VWLNYDQRLPVRVPHLSEIVPRLLPTRHPTANPLSAWVAPEATAVIGVARPSHPDIVCAITAGYITRDTAVQGLRVTATWFFVTRVARGSPGRGSTEGRIAL